MAEKVGICVSGGGIRAASFGLGALQALQEKLGLLYGINHADYLAAVSGGAYIAGAYTMLNSPYPDPKNRVNAVVAEDPFGRGTPEVEYLRRRARYLVGGGTYAETVTQVLGRLLINIGFLALLVVVVGRTVGYVSQRSPNLAKDDHRISR